MADKRQELRAQRGGSAVAARDVPVPAVYRDEVSGIRLPRVVLPMLWLLFVGFWPKSFSTPIDAALTEETRLGLEVIRSGETRAGAERFAAGAGRHGDFKRI